MGFESDTTNVMVGKHNSFLSRVKDKQPNVHVFSQGCVCHLSVVKVLQIDILCRPLLLLQQVCKAQGGI